MFYGGYPAIYQRSLEPPLWFQSYISTYLERDVRTLLNVNDLSAFQTFLGLCAGHSGQLMNLSQLGSDTGISHNTARSWISVLETSYLVHRIQPLHANIKKRLIRTPDELRTHPLRGSIFESFVISEILKQRFNQIENRRILYYRDRQGLEVDAIVETAGQMTAIEIKSSATVSAHQFKALKRFTKLLRDTGMKINPFLVCGGTETQHRSDVTVVSWNQLHDFRWY